MPDPQERIAALRERVRGRTWRPSAERVEILCALSELFAPGQPAADGALELAATLMAETFGDAILIAAIASSGQWMFPLAAHDRDRVRAEVLAGLVGNRILTDHGFAHRMLVTGKALRIPWLQPPEVVALQPELGPLAVALGPHGVILAPVPGNTHVAGLVCQIRTRPEPPLDEDDKRFLTEVAIRLTRGLADWAW
jgi:hypothetical protein